MSRFNGPFLFKVIIFLVIMTVSLSYIELTATATTDRFGNLGWIHWMTGLLLAAAGVIATWATAITLIDRWSLKRYRADASDELAHEQTVALAGTIRVEGEPIIAPFSQTPSACVSYQIKGEHRSSSSDGGSSTRSHLCVLGFELVPAFLETGKRRLRLQAIADVDADLRHVDSGRKWGEQAYEIIQRLAQDGTRTDAPEAQNALSSAQKATCVPTTEALFVALTNRSANISVIEDTVPVDTEVTVLARFDALAEALDGQRLGGMKVFPGGIDERLAGLAKEAKVGGSWGLGLLITGVALLTLAMWWPA